MRAMKGRVLFGVLCALAVVSAASAGGTATPGVTSKQILIGGTTPLSGPASAYAAVAKGADAYFSYVNDHGGVFGRKIEYKYVDDAYDPSQTIPKVRDLVQNDKVFAIYNVLGTQQNLAIRS
jgi:branched-chain amino acid transport system substrate-binding protein